MNSRSQPKQQRHASTQRQRLKKLRTTSQRKKSSLLKSAPLPQPLPTRRLPLLRLPSKPTFKQFPQKPLLVNFSTIPHTSAPPTANPTPFAPQSISTLPSLESITTPGQLGQYFRTLASSPQLTPTLNQHYASLTTGPLLSKFVSIPPSVYCSVIEANITSDDSRQVTGALLDSITHNIRLPSHVIMLAIKQLSNAGQIDSIESILQALITVQTRAKSASSSSNTQPAPSPTSSSQTASHQSQHDPKATTPTAINLLNHPLIDSQTANQVKEGLVLAYVSKLRLQDSITALSRVFGPGSGSIPSDQLLDVITKHLLRFDRPRHAQQLMQQFDVYCTPKTKSRLYSKIAGSYLDSKMLDHLNTLLGYMDSNSIAPHPSMMERLLAHIVNTSSPLLSLKWYQQVYNINAPVLDYQRHGGQHFTSQQQEQQQNTANEIQSYLNQSSSTSSTSASIQNSQLFAHAQQKSLGFNIKAANTILEGLFKANHHHQALNLLSKLPIHISTVNVVLKSAYYNHDWDSLRLVFKYMLLRGLPLDQQGLHILIQALAFHTNPAALTTLLDTLTLKNNIKLHPLTYVRFIRALKTQGYPKLCELVLNRMKAAAPKSPPISLPDSPSSPSTSHQSSNQRANDLLSLNDMDSSIPTSQQQQQQQPPPSLPPPSWKPDASVYTMVIQSYLDHKLLREAFRIKEVMENDGIQPSLMTYAVFLDGLIRSGEALGLYHILTEIFTRADELVFTQHDFSKLQHTFPRSKEFLLKAQSDPNFTKRQQFVTFLRPYVWATCSLLTGRGHKRHSDNLASFWYANGGAQINEAVAQSEHADQTNFASSSTARAGQRGSQGKGEFVEFGGIVDNAGMKEVLDQIQSERDLLANEPPHDEDALLARDDLTMGTLDQQLRRYARNGAQNGQIDDNGDNGNQKGSRHSNLKTERLRQLQLRDDDLYGSMDAIFDEIGTKGGRWGPNTDEIQQSDEMFSAIDVSTSSNLINHALTNTLIFDPFPHLSSPQLGAQLPGDRQNTNTKHDVSGLKSMFDVHHLHSLPANSLNDYIDRSTAVGAFNRSQPPSHFQRSSDHNQQHYQNQVQNQPNRGGNKHAKGHSNYKNQNASTTSNGHHNPPTRHHKHGGKGWSGGNSKSPKNNNHNQSHSHFSTFLAAASSSPGNNSPSEQRSSQVDPPNNHKAPNSLFNATLRRSTSLNSTQPENVVEMLGQLSKYHGEYQM